MNTSNGFNPPQHERARFAAVFLDFENVYYFFKNTYFDPSDLNDHILDLLRNLREKIAEQYGLDCILLNAYADFERLESAPQGALYLLGVDTKNVMGTDHKNAADMRLCIDVLETLYTRPEIDTFVLVAGDRDYIPVIQHLRRQARHVLGVGFRETVSGDLLLNLGEAQFLDARELLDDATWERLEARRAEGLRLEEERRARWEEQTRAIEDKARAAQLDQLRHQIEDETVEDGAGSTAENGEGGEQNITNLNTDASEAAARELENATRDLEREIESGEESVDLVPVHFAPVERLVDEKQRQCLQIVLEKLHRLGATRHSNELWLGPFLRQLADDLPSLAEYERRRVLDGLTRAGAIRVEKRQGEPYPYSVVLVNYQHPDVWDLNPG